MQIFVKNNMQWFAASPFAAAELRAFHEHPSARDRLVFGHSGYMINLAAANPDFLEKSRRALREELLRADELGCRCSSCIPGAHMARESRRASRKSSRASTPSSPRSRRSELASRSKTPPARVVPRLRIPHLAGILEDVREPERLCVCLDTAHLFASGYDISTAAGAQKVFREFDRIVGASTSSRFISTTRKPRSARASIATNTSAKADRSRSLPLHHDCPALRKNSQSPRNAERQGDEGGHRKLRTLRSLCRPGGKIAPPHREGSVSWRAPPVTDRAPLQGSQA